MIKAFQVTAVSPNRARKLWNFLQECCLMGWTADSLLTPHLSKHAQDPLFLPANNERSETRMFRCVHLLYFHVQINTHRMLGLFFFSPCRAYLAYTCVFLWLVAKAWPGAIYQNNLLSGGNLLLTDKSLPSVGCNGSHLSFFSEYCPSRPPPRQTQLNDCSLFRSCLSKSTAAASSRPQ